jgi:hypothetical protein
VALPVGIAVRHARAQIEAQMPRRVDWPTIVDLAGWNGLIRPCIPRSRNRDCALSYLGCARALCASSMRRDALRRGEAAAQIARVSAALNAAGIEPLWLKGAALIVEDSAWANRRWMSDIDVWVAPGSVDAAACSVARRGYRHDPRQPHAADITCAPFSIPARRLPSSCTTRLPARGRRSHADRARPGNARRMHWRGAHVVIPGALDQAVHIASQARPSAAAYLHGRLRLRRVVEFAQLATVTGAQEAADALRSACAAGGTSASSPTSSSRSPRGLCEFPGGFELACRDGGRRVEDELSAPALRSTSGCGAVARHGSRLPRDANPTRFARNLVAHVRRSMDTRW